MTAPVMVAAPGQSNRCRVPVARSSSTRRARTTEATDTGTVTRNTDDQPNEPARSPPTKTPVAPPTAEAAPQMLIALARACSGEGQHEQRHGSGAERGGAGALDDRGPPTSIPSFAAAAASRVPSGEQGRAGREHAASAEQVRGTSGQQQQSAEREDVGVDHPGQAGRAEPEVGLDGRKRHVDDRGVQHDDELGGHQQCERDGPASALDKIDAPGTMGGAVGDYCVWGAESRTAVVWGAARMVVMVGLPLVVWMHAHGAAGGGPLAPAR